MLRFYAKRVGNEYHLLNSQELNQKVYTENELFGCKSNFCEILVCAGYIRNVLGVNHLDVDEIKPAALKAAEDHNVNVLMPKQELLLNRKNSQELRETFQEYIDRSQLYGSNFEKEFQSLMQKFPINVKVKDNYYRTVTL